MNDLSKAIWEHLKTRRKYNTLKLKYEVLQEDYDKKIIELNTERRIHIKRQEIWEQKLKAQEEEIANLKKRKRNAGNNTKKKSNPKNKVH